MTSGKPHHHQSDGVHDGSRVAYAGKAQAKLFQDGRQTGYGVIEPHPYPANHRAGQHHRDEEQHPQYLPGPAGYIEQAAGYYDG